MKVPEIIHDGKFALLVTVCAMVSEDTLKVVAVPRRWTCM